MNRKGLNLKWKKALDSFLGRGKYLKFRSLDHYFYKYKQNSVYYRWNTLKEIYIYKDKDMILDYYIYPDKSEIMHLTIL